MANMGTLISVLVGVLCAAAGIVARPKTPNAENKARTIVTAAAAATPVLGWVLCLGHPLAASLGFLVGTIVLGELRDRMQKALVQRTPVPSGIDVPNAPAPPDNNVAASSSRL